MRAFNIILTSLLLILTSASPAPSLTTNSTEEPDIIASWALRVFTDGGCQNELVSTGGNTPSGCQTLAMQANSYAFHSTTDPKFGVSFSISLYSSQNCQNLIATDNGKTQGCTTINFESWSVFATIATSGG